LPLPSARGVVAFLLPFALLRHPRREQRKLGDRVVARLVASRRGFARA
jgi:hypothetical protein